MFFVKTTSFTRSKSCLGIHETQVRVLYSLQSTSFIGLMVVYMIVCTSRVFQQNKITLLPCTRLDLNLSGSYRDGLGFVLGL